MIHGDAIRFARTVWTVSAATKTVATVSGDAARLVLVRPAVASVAKAGLAQARSDAGQLLLVEADGVGSGRDLVQNGVADRGSAGRLLERGGVEIGDSVEPVDVLRVLPGGVAHAFAQGAVVGEHAQERSDSLGLAVVDRNFGRDRRRELRKPPGVADDQRLAGRECADRHSGGLAPRRPAKRDADVAGDEQRPEPVLRNAAVVN